MLAESAPVYISKFLIKRNARPISCLTCRECAMTISYSQRAFFQITSQVAAYGSILPRNGARQFVSSVMHWFVRCTTLSDASIIPSFFSRQYARAARNESRESASRAFSRKQGVEAEKSICLRSALRIEPVPNRSRFPPPTTLERFTSRSSVCSRNARKIPRRRRS